MSTPLVAAIGGTWPYVGASWIFVFASIGLFAIATVVRGRRLSRRVPPERRRWS